MANLLPTEEIGNVYKRFYELLYGKIGTTRYGRRTQEYCFS